VRWDSGVEAGSTVGVEFDPMLAKVVAYGPTRAEAAGRLALALERLHVGGVTTNRDFLAATLRHESFLAGDTTTDFIDRVKPAAGVELDDATLSRLSATAALWVQGENRAAATVLAGLPSGWRNARLPAEQISFAHGEHTIDVAYRCRRDGSFELNDNHAARVHSWTADHIDAEIDGHRSVTRITRDHDRLHLQHAGGTIELSVVPRFEAPGHDVPSGGMTAPMPGVVLDVRVDAGAEVRAGQTLVVLEAMKMEHHIKAPVDGTVAEVSVAAGDQVDNGQALLMIDDGEEQQP